MGKIVDIYMPLDEREEPNNAVWPIAVKQLKELIHVIKRFGWESHVLNPDKPVSSVAEGIQVINHARGDRFINFMAGWAYPDFSVTPMWHLPSDLPKLMLGSAISDFPGAVGLLATAAGTSHVGIKTNRLFVENFDNVTDYEEAIYEFLENGRYDPDYPKPIDVPVSDSNRSKAQSAVSQLKGSIYGAIGPRSMQMWNKISEADFLKYFGVAREGFDGIRLLKMAEAIPDHHAEKAIDFLIKNGMDLRLGTDPARHLTKDMIIFQMKVYFALLELQNQYGLDFIGLQDQLDWTTHYPATDLTLGILNNVLRPESNGKTLVSATEADDGAAVTMQVLKLLSGGDPVGFNDLRYWRSDDRLYWFVNSGSLAPYFAHGSHSSLKGAWSERQTSMYFKQGGGTCTLVVRIPGVVTWARFFFRNHQLCLCAGRGVTDVPSEEQWKERSSRCNPEWPQWYLKLCGPIEWKLNTNHPMTVLGDHLSDLKAVAEELDIPFECYDDITPNQLS